ncbi:MAG: FeoB-associated Cys-rich membrane protein [Clostridiaceae bacterium]|nr:FeoB-associated Cys-rich membrane protein [Clostridiaceae bacterium]
MNIPTILISLIILAACIAILRREVRNRKSGKGSCSCGGCTGCPSSGMCHPKK